MGQKELVAQMRQIANSQEVATLPDRAVVVLFVRHLFTNFTTMTDHPTFSAVRVSDFVVEGLTDNLLVNADKVHSLHDVEMIVTGAALAIGLLQLQDYVQQQNTHIGS